MKNYPNNNISLKTLLDACNKINSIPRVGVADYVIANSYVIEKFFEEYEHWKKMKERIKKLKNIKTKI